MKPDLYAELEKGIYNTLETYSNVHRGSGHYSMVSTHLFGRARNIILDYLGLKEGKYTVVFCTPRGATILAKQIEPKNFQTLSSLDLCLSLGVRALAIKTNALPKGVPFQTGGGTTKLVSKNWVIWADVPDKFEAGTPAIVNIAAFAKALIMVQQFGKDIFLNSTVEELTPSEILHRDELEKFSGRELLLELQKTLIGRNILVPTMEGLKPFTNLDNSASTPTFEPIWNAFRHAWRQSENVKQEIVNEVKSICAKALGAPQSNYDVIFTSNTTEAINLLSESLRSKSEIDTEPVVLNTLLEHSSNDLPWRSPNNSLIRLSVNPEGFIDFNELETLLVAYNKENKYDKKRIKLVAVSGASNVLGVCNNIAEISQIAHRYGAHILVDAAQLVAHRKVNMEECDIDYLAFSAHKVYAPFGCGVLVAKKGLLNFSSAELDLIKTLGEENVGGIAALGKALVLLQRIGMDVIHAEEQVLIKHALKGMANIPGLQLYGIQDPESPNFSHKVGVILFNIKGAMPFNVAKQLATQGGIGVRSGCHCAHIIIKHLLNVTPSLERFQSIIQTLFPKLKFPGLVRMSLGIENSETDVDKFVKVLGSIAKKPNKVDAKTTEPNQDNKAKLTNSVVQKQIKDFVNERTVNVYSKY
jgi:selenocysteine lyase/cysteine desulfurase